MGKEEKNNRIATTLATMSEQIQKEEVQKEIPEELPGPEQAFQESRQSGPRSFLTSSQSASFIPAIKPKSYSRTNLSRMDAMRASLSEATLRGASQQFAATKEAKEILAMTSHAMHWLDPSRR